MMWWFLNSHRIAFPSQTYNWLSPFPKTPPLPPLPKAGWTCFPMQAIFTPLMLRTSYFMLKYTMLKRPWVQVKFFLVTYSIESHYSDMAMERYKKFQKQQAAAVNVAFNQFSIKELPSGNYNLCIEARNRDNELLALKKLFFQRSNPTIAVQLGELEELRLKNTFVEKFATSGEIAEHIRCLHPISTGKERTFANNQLAVTDLELMRKYFLRFWTRRDPLTPEKAWVDYKAQVDKADKEFKTPIRKGYETDRGRGIPAIRPAQQR